MKKDKQYPLALGDPMGGVPRPGSQPGAAAAAAAAAAARGDVYGSMNGSYMPNGSYSYDPSALYGQSPYGSYGRSDMYPGYSCPTSGSSSLPSYMNGAYAASMSMYGSSAAANNSAGNGGGNSPYGSSIDGNPHGQGQHSPGGGSVKSENGQVSMPSESPGSTSAPSQPPSAGYVKREVSPPAGSGGNANPPPSGPPPPNPLPPTSGSGNPPQQQDLNRMISMYLPGDAAAAAAGDPNAQSRISMYAGHYQQAMAAQAAAASNPPPTGAPPSTDHLGHPLPMAHM